MSQGQNKISLKLRLLTKFNRQIRSGHWHDSTSIPPTRAVRGGEREVWAITKICFNHDAAARILKFELRLPVVRIIGTDIQSTIEELRHRSFTQIHPHVAVEGTAEL